MIDDSTLQRLSVRIGSRLNDRKMCLATAESCTGGFIAKVLTDIAGSSAWFKEGYVTYSNESKMSVLRVRAPTLARYGAVSEQVARQMAIGALRRSGCRVAVAVTGIAGPGGGTPGKPVGLVWLAWAIRYGQRTLIVSVRKRFLGNRDEVRRKTVHCALQGVLRVTR